MPSPCVLANLQTRGLTWGTPDTPTNVENNNMYVKYMRRKEANVQWLFGVYYDT